MTRTAAAVLGVSHLVLSVADLDAAEAFAAGCGYGRRGEVSRGDNPAQKASVVDGPLSDYFDMRLMASGSGLPTLELLREGGADPVPRTAGRFTALLSHGELSPEEARVGLGAAAAFPGFRRLDSGTARLLSVIVRCPDLPASLAFWERLGMTPEDLGGGIRRVRVRGLTPSARMSLVFMPGPADEPGYLNREGLSCLSFFCRDADALRAALSASGCAVSDCFNLAPFGRSLRVFFARPESGELYEFVAVGRAADKAVPGGSSSCQRL